jgi:hypothetical protein
MPAICDGADSLVKQTKPRSLRWCSEVRNSPFSRDRFFAVHEPSAGPRCREKPPDAEFFQGPRRQSPIPVRQRCFRLLLPPPTPHPTSTDSVVNSGMTPKEHVNRGRQDSLRTAFAFRPACPSRTIIAESVLGERRRTRSSIALATVWHRLLVQGAVPRRKKVTVFFRPG